MLRDGLKKQSKYSNPSSLGLLKDLAIETILGTKAAEQTEMNQVSTITTSDHLSLNPLS